MARQAEYKGQTFEFPDTATDEDIMSFLADNAEQMIAQKQEAPVEQETQDVVLPEPPQDLTGQTEVEQPVPATDWAPLPSAEGPSNWSDTAQPSNVNPGYRGDGSVNYDDPRWRGMNPYGIASATAWDDTKNAVGDVWDALANSREPDAYTRQVQQNKEDFARPFREQVPTGRGQEGMDAEALKAMYGDKPSVWDNLDPEVAAANVPQASEQGASLLDAVYTEKARLMAKGLDDAEAEKQAFEKAQRDSLQFAASVAAAPVGASLGGAVGLGARMGAQGAVNTVAGSVADVAADKELDKGTMAEDFFWGSLGGLGGKTGTNVAKSAIGEGADNLKVLKDSATQQLDDLAKQARGKEAVSASLSSSKPMSEALEGTKTITASDMVDARNVSATLQTLNKAGGKTDISDILKTVKNEELRSILQGAAPVRAAAVKADDAIKNVIGQDLGELLGFGTTTNKKANREAVSSVASDMTDSLKWSQESLDIVGNFKGETKKSFDKVFKELERAQQMVLDGRFTQAKRELAKSDNKKALFRKDFGSTAAQEIQRLKTELDTIVTVGKDTVGYSQPQNLLGKIKSMGVPTLAAYATNPLYGAAVSAGKAAGQFGLNKVNAKKLADVEKALGGKLKVDAEAERMLANGAAIGDVIGYLVSKMFREE